jgi:hypothetical protein
MSRDTDPRCRSATENLKIIVTKSSQTKSIADHHLNVIVFSEAYAVAYRPQAYLQLMFLLYQHANRCKFENPVIGYLGSSINMTTIMTRQLQ